MAEGSGPPPRGAALGGQYTLDILEPPEREPAQLRGVAWDAECSAWRDMANLPSHAEYLKKLEPLVVDGGSRWVVLREAEVVTGSD
jgi:hypothetical protein